MTEQQQGRKITAEESGAGRPNDPATGLAFAPVVEAVAAGGSAAWAVHFRAQKRKAAGDDIILLTVGDPDFHTPEAIKESAIAALREGQTRYSDAGGIQPLLKAVAKVEGERLGLPVGPENVVVTSGAQNALYITFRCLVAAGDEVLLVAPPYVMFEGVVTACGASAKRVPLKADEGFRLDLEGLAAAVTPRSRAILINSPHNPSGAVASREEIEALAALCKAKGLWLVSDEVYADLCYDGPFHSPASLPGMAERTVVIRSLSKSHAMAGWRIGWAVAPATLATHMRNLINHVLYGGAAFLQQGAVTGLTQDLAEVAEMKEAYRQRRDVFCDALSALPGVKVVRPASGIFCLIDISKSGLSASAFADRLLEEQGVSVLPGGAFDPSIAHMVRVSLCQPAEVLQEAARRIGRFLAGLEKGAA